MYTQSWWYRERRKVIWVPSSSSPSSSSCRHTHVCCLSLRILKNIKSFIPCVPSFVVYFFYVSLTVDFLDFFLHFFLFSNILFGWKWNSTQNSFFSPTSSFRALRLTLLDTFLHLGRKKRAARVCVWFYNSIKTSDFAYELLCEFIAKAAITTFHFFRLSGRLSTGLKMSQAKSDKNTYSCLLDLNLWTKTGAKKQKVAADSGFFGSLTQKSEHTHKPEIYSVREDSQIPTILFLRWYNLFFTMV